ncbi:hypothetical protein M3Y99_00978800 [Aphelenchoides fujianensis]|nr:hypothetical protein M3Y99_00978800 [Aphelenchoides fujianensis]
MAALLLVLLLLSPAADAYISRGFFSFLKLRYGREYANDVARYDYGPIGSFGGGLHVAGQKTQRTPVVFVAGWHSTASFSWPAVTVWLLHGYSMAELYGTSYGIPLGLVSYQFGLQCKRPDLEKGEPAAYNCRPLPTDSQAILGGRCVDTGEDLGPPLTALVDTYLGVGGANNGAFGCSVLPVPGVCSAQAGMHCHSAFIRDTNAQQRYEGRTVYVLQSSTDELVGYHLCGKHAAEIEGANRTVTLFGFEHLALCTITPFQQYNLIHKGSIL